MLTDKEKQAIAEQQKLSKRHLWIRSAGVLVATCVVGIFAWYVINYLVNWMAGPLEPAVESTSSSEAPSQPTASEIVAAASEEAEKKAASNTESDKSPPYAYTEVIGLMPEREVPAEVYQDKLVISIVEEGIEFAVAPTLEGHVTIEAQTTKLTAAPEDYSNVWTYNVKLDDYVAGSLYIIHMDYVGDFEAQLQTKLHRVMDIDTTFTVCYQDFVDVPEEMFSSYVQPSSIMQVTQALRDSIRFKE